MLYTVLPGLSLCLSLLNSNESTIQQYIRTPAGADFKFKCYTKMLEGAMVLVDKAKTLNNRSDLALLGELISSEKNGKNAEITNTSCPEKPIDCEEIFMECGTNKSGVYRVWSRSRVGNADNGILVYCDMETDGGGWTVFQRRSNFGPSSDFFHRGWLSYKYGFGDVGNDFWLGNDKISALSNQRSVVLRIEILDTSNIPKYALYHNFYIDDESQIYKLHISNYSGNAGDSLRNHNLMNFSTMDKDNDISSNHCGKSYKGGWWYHSSCQNANPNTGYNNIIWQSIYVSSMKKSEMKLRSTGFGRTSPVTTVRVNANLLTPIG